MKKEPNKLNLVLGDDGDYFEKLSTFSSTLSVVQMKLPTGTGEEECGHWRRNSGAFTLNQGEWIWTEGLKVPVYHESKYRCFPDDWR